MVKILSPNLYPSHPANAPPQRKPMSLVSSGSFQRWSMLIQIHECVLGSLFFLFILWGFELNLQVWIFQRRGFGQWKKEYGNERQEKIYVSKRQIRCIGQALLCCGNMKCEARRRGSPIMARSDCHAAGQRCNLAGSRTPTKTFKYKMC